VHQKRAAFLRPFSVELPGIEPRSFKGADLRKRRKTARERTRKYASFRRTTRGVWMPSTSFAGPQSVC